MSEGFFVHASVQVQSSQTSATRENTREQSSLCSLVTWESRDKYGMTWIWREVRRAAILFIDHQVSQWKLWFAHSFQFYRSSKGLYSFWIAESRSGSREIVHINELRNNIARPSTAEWCGEFPTFECTLGRLKKRRQLSDKLCLDMFWIIPFHGECKHPADSASLQ